MFELTIKTLFKIHGKRTIVFMRNRKLVYLTQESGRRLCHEDMSSHEFHMYMQNNDASCWYD